MPLSALAVHLDRLRLLNDQYRLSLARTPQEMKLAEEIRRELEAATTALATLASRLQGQRGIAIS